LSISNFIKYEKFDNTFINRFTIRGQKEKEKEYKKEKEKQQQVLYPSLEGNPDIEIPLQNSKSIVLKNINTHKCCSKTFVGVFCLCKKTAYHSIISQGILLS
jgi:hypothetical protein